MDSVSIIRTGAANLASVTAAFTRLNIATNIVEAPEQFDRRDRRDRRDRLVLPGVGSFRTGMDTLRTRGWDEILAQRFEQDLPTLAICLGFQLLCKSSEEAPGTEGLGLLPATVSRFVGEVSVPQLGWNKISSSNDLFESEYVYFANSFCVTNIDDLAMAGWYLATCKHGIDFVAAAARGNWLACQFHPELSGYFGKRILQRWLTTTAVTAESSPTADTKKQVRPC